MSLVNSEYSTKSRAGSVYQTTGKPLSKEALYRAKLKYGIYQAPSQDTIGVPNGVSASDTAALLATSSDLSVHAYKRTVASEAQTAALFARKDTAPKAWTRDAIADDAASSALAAAASLKSKTPVVVDDSATSRNDYIQAAKSVTSKSSAASLSDAASTKTGATSLGFDISNISKISTEKAQSAVHDRLNPEKKSSIYGLQVNSKLSDSQYESFAAVGALASQNVKMPVDEKLEEYNVYKNSLVDKKVLERARLNASATLKGVDKYLEGDGLFSNPEFNAAAVAIAKRHQEKRVERSEKINLGGGLFMTQAELDEIAKKIVNPVLEDINKEAKAQRTKDAEIAKKRQEQKQQYDKLKSEEKAKKLADKQFKQESKLKRKKEMEEEKKRQEESLTALEKSKKVELDKQKALLAAKQAEQTKKSEELSTKKKLETSRLKEEEAKANAIRQAELEKIKQDRDLRLNPILADLKAEEERLALLNEEKLAIETITNSQIEDYKIAEQLLETSTNELNFTKEKLEKLKAEIENSNVESEKLAKEAELKKVEADLAIKKSQEIEAEAKLKQVELDQEKLALENKKLDLELKLEQAKIDALNEEKKIAEILPPAVVPTDDTESVLEPEVLSDVDDDADAEEKPAAATPASSTSAPTAPKIATAADTAPVSKSVAPASSSPVVRRPSMVDAVIPKDYVPPVRKNSIKRANSISNEKKSVSRSNSTTKKSSKPPSRKNSIKQKLTSSHQRKISNPIPIKKEKEADDNELKPTFSGFSQGSNDNEENDDLVTNTTASNSSPITEPQDNSKGLFKEQF